MSKAAKSLDSQPLNFLKSPFSIQTINGPSNYLLV